jgi:hypothetical protein
MVSGSARTDCFGIFRHLLSALARLREALSAQPNFARLVVRRIGVRARAGQKAFVARRIRVLRPRFASAGEFGGARS